MKRIEVLAAAAHSIVLLRDPVNGQIPGSMAGKVAAATASCVAIGTRPGADGVTRVSLLDPEAAANEVLPPILALASRIQTSSEVLVLTDEIGETYATWPQLLGNTT